MNVRNWALRNHRLGMEENEHAADWNIGANQKVRRKGQEYAAVHNDGGNFQANLQHRAALQDRCCHQPASCWASMARRRFSHGHTARCEYTANLEE